MSLKVAYLSARGPDDLLYWSGTAHYIGKSLSDQGLQVSHLGPFTAPLPRLYLLKHRFYSEVRGKNYMAEYDRLRARLLGRLTGAAIERVGADVALGFTPDLLAYAKTKVPLAVWTDCTFPAMKDFYPYYTNLCRETLRDGFALEKEMFDRCRICFFACEWAARSAREHYHLAPEKSHLVPFGANIECRRTLEDIKVLIEQRQTKPCRLLFIGRIWQRKGGDIALAVAEKLNASGLPTELTLVGSGPTDGRPLPPYVKSLGFVSKTTPEGRRQLDELLARSHFLIVPSRAEAYGIVFCEASSFGVPSLATNVGGIPTVIRNGLNGWTFPLEASADEYCAFVLKTMEKPETYRQLALSSFGEYESRLNWRVAGARVKQLLEQSL
jgi:glycosyltransferase involved in cell wall biosynthesis